MLSHQHLRQFADTNDFPSFGSALVTRFSSVTISPHLVETRTQRSKLFVPMRCLLD